MVYRFIDNNKEYFGLRWLCRKFDISPNGYYNYLAAVIMRKKPGYSDFINSDLAIKTLTKALEQEKYPKNLILHSDQGGPFASWDFVMFCKKNSITQSMSRAGCPYDNAPMERFYNTFRSCFYYRFTFESVEKRTGATCHLPVFS